MFATEAALENVMMPLFCRRPKFWSEAECITLRRDPAFKFMLLKLDEPSQNALLASNAPSARLTVPPFPTPKL